MTVKPEVNEDMAGSAVFIDVDTEGIFVLAGVTSVSVRRDSGDGLLNLRNHIRKCWSTLRDYERLTNDSG